jgi:hypothetical protein
MNTVSPWASLPAFYPIVLTKEGDDDLRLNANWGCIERTERNIMRVSLAAGLSTAGAMIAGFVPTIGGIFAGGALGGIGNGASTWLAWEKSEQHFIEARLISDFPKVLERSRVINQYLDEVIGKMQKIYSVTATVNESMELSFDPLDEDINYLCCSLSRNQRNFFRLCTAGGLSAAGGWLGGLLPTPGGIIGGAILGGLGNGVSTWLAYEQTHDAEIYSRALKDLPHLFQQLNNSASTLLDLVESIKLQNLKCLMAEEPELSLINSDDISECCISLRYLRNFSYVNIAGWMSAIGGWVGGYWPHPAGIIIGGSLQSAANAISTWLAWEKANDKEMGKTAVEHFPELVLKVNEISKKLITLSALTRTCLKLEDRVSTLLEI